MLTNCQVIRFVSDIVFVFCSVLEYKVLIGEIMFSVPTATEHQKNKAVASKIQNGHHAQLWYKSFREFLLQKE